MLPGIAIVRKGDAGLNSTFIGIYEPCEGESFISSVKRLEVLNKEVLDKTENKSQTGNDEAYCQECHCQDDYSQEGAVGVEIKTVNGCCDLIMLADMKNKGIMIQPEWDVETDAAFCAIRKDKKGNYKATIMNGSYLRFRDCKFQLDSVIDVYETSFN